MSCACPCCDAYDCVRRRYDDSLLGEEVEPCECPCHDGEPDAYDDAMQEHDIFLLAPDYRSPAFLYRWEDAPEALRALSTHGGDED